VFFVSPRTFAGALPFVGCAFATAFLLASVVGCCAEAEVVVFFAPWPHGNAGVASASSAEAVTRRATSFFMVCSLSSPGPATELPAFAAPLRRA
jgi:hypothetical protein